MNTNELAKFKPSFSHSDTDFVGILSKETIQFHYEKHHAGYANKLNELIANTEYTKFSLENIIKKSRDNNDVKIFNNAAQLYNHDFYWKCLKLNCKPNEKLVKIVEAQFLDFETFLKKYIEHANGFFASGWAWVVQKNNGALCFESTKNAELPDGVHICVIDLWEHAYYIDYRNDRAKYIDSIVHNGINWEFVGQRLGL